METRADLKQAFSPSRISALNFPNLSSQNVGVLKESHITNVTRGNAHEKTLSLAHPILVSLLSISGSAKVQPASGFQAGPGPCSTLTYLPNQVPLRRCCTYNTSAYNRRRTYPGTAILKAWWKPLLNFLVTLDEH